ncbi:S-adenosylmethionine-dependent methyltransferase [Diatrype stigma]|uniref:S-adenosylmethionine-dependent methyltransferase n=1 Tax=Diatrype stigma TaxID=117547 RepID=A0AAN9YKF9_9PEZI
MYVLLTYLRHSTPTRPPMLPTPDTSHVAYERVYEPAEDSFLFLDTLSSASETAFLRDRFFSAGPPTPTPAPAPAPAGDGDDRPSLPPSQSPPPPPPPPPFVVEIGPGSGVVIAFANAHAGTLFGTGTGTGTEAGARQQQQQQILTAAIDVNVHACRATGETVRKAAAAAATPIERDTIRARDGADEQRATTTTSSSSSGTWLGTAQGDLTAPLRDGCVDVLIFNPPYVPTAEIPMHSPPPPPLSPPDADTEASTSASTFETDSRLLALSWAGGRDGMETTERLLADLPRVLSARGCAYVLLCAQNRPEEVKRRVVAGEYWGGGGGGDDASRRSWRAETVGSSGKTAGWEKLQIIRIWREGEGRRSDGRTD